MDIDRHLRVLSVACFVVAGALMVLGLSVYVLVDPPQTWAADAYGREFALEHWDAVQAGLFGVFAALACFALIAGIGVRRRRRWGRAVAMTLCGLSLLSLPLGTAFGVYGLWVLTRPEAAEAFVAPALP